MLLALFEFCRLSGGEVNDKSGNSRRMQAAQDRNQQDKKREIEARLQQAIKDAAKATFIFARLGETRMNDKERIPVFLKIVNGKTLCVCHAYNKGCKLNCERDTVTRERYEGWQKTLYRNKYGR